MCQYQLTDVNEGDGGLGMIPGSHKMNFRLPAGVSASWSDGIVPPVACPMAKAGSLIIFLEATQHGTLPWAGDGERRALFYRYSPKYLNFVAGTYTTEQARALVLSPPPLHGRRRGRETPQTARDGDTQ